VGHPVVLSLVFIKSVLLRCLRNPACSFRRCCSTVFCILFKITLVRILLGILKRVIPLRLLQFDRSPVFGILIISPSSHSSGIFSSFHIFCNRGYGISTFISESTFNTSGFILSRPANFPFFNCVRANCISVFFRRVQVYFGLIFIFTIIIFNISHFLLYFCFIVILVEYFRKNVLAISSVVLLLFLRAILI
jgi:hypothetical protein